MICLLTYRFISRIPPTPIVSSLSFTPKQNINSAKEKHKKKKHAIWKKCATVACGNNKPANNCPFCCCKHPNLPAFKSRHIASWAAHVPTQSKHEGNYVGARLFGVSVCVFHVLRLVAHSFPVESVGRGARERHASILIVQYCRQFGQTKLADSISWSDEVSSVQNTKYFFLFRTQNPANH